MTERERFNEWRDNWYFGPGVNEITRLWTCWQACSKQKDKEIEKLEVKCPVCGMYMGLRKALGTEDNREVIIQSYKEKIKEALKVLQNNLSDMDMIDNLCAMAMVHPYSLMRKEITDAIASLKESID